jgi:hypothetical protein
MCQVLVLGFQVLVLANQSQPVGSLLFVLAHPDLFEGVGPLLPGLMLLQGEQQDLVIQLLNQHILFTHSLLQLIHLRLSNAYPLLLKPLQTALSLQLSLLQLQLHSFAHLLVLWPLGNAVHLPQTVLASS